MLKKLIILTVFVGVGFFVCSSMQRRANAFKIQTSVYPFIANGRLKDAISYLEQNENQMKKPEDYLAFGYAYATVAEYVKKFNWRPQSNPPNADSIYAKAVDVIQSGIAIGNSKQNELAYLYLSGIYWKKDDAENQIKSLEEAASTTKSNARKSYYYYSMAMRCLDRVVVRFAKQTKKDTLLMEQGWKYLEEAIQIYPHNYEALMYMSKNTESKIKAAEFYEQAKAALPIYEKDAIKENIYGTIQLLAKFDPLR